jgi:lysine-N-methylase
MDLRAIRCMTSFRCLGPACEDDCCHGWNIFVDEPHYEKLVARMSTPEERAELAARVRPIEGGGRHRHALVSLDASLRCRFHDEERLCSLQRRYGEDYLPDGCASYPRVIGRVGPTYELTGAVSCPEVARLVLAADDALELVPGSRDHAARGMVSLRVELESEDGYERSFLLVRALLVELLARRQYPIASRLFFVAFIGDRTRAELRHGGPGLTLEELTQLYAAARTEANLDHLHDQLVGLALEPTYALSVVRSVLKLPVKLVPPALRQLTQDVAELLPEGSDPAEWSALPPPAPWLEERLDAWLTRVAVHYLHREWFVKAPSLAVYAHGLLARAAVLRVLITGNPAVRAATAPSPEVDAVATRAVYSLSRLLEHDRALADGLLADLDEKGMTTLEHAACLAYLLLSPARASTR